MFTSPSIARLAETPPVVGWVRTEMNGRPRSDSLASAAEVFAIWNSENSDSCMRAPPEDEKQMYGLPCWIAASAPRTNFSPTTEPIEPPMKAKSKALATSGRPCRRPRITISASRSPVPAWAILMRSLYRLPSLNFSGSSGLTSIASSSRPSASRNCCSRARPRMGRCALHLGHTSRVRSSSVRYSAA